MSDTNERPVSAYKFICDSLERMPGLPYAFQDVRAAGRSNTEFVIFENDMPLRLQHEMAKRICDELTVCVNRQTVTEELAELLYAPPIFAFFEGFMRRLTSLYDENILDHEQLYRFGTYLARESASSEEVKLGMMILGLFPNDITKTMLRTLGLHSEFTMTAIKSMRAWPHFNGMVFDFAANTTGYGRLAAIFHFLPLSATQQSWLFYDALRTPIRRGAIADYILSAPDMQTFYDALTVDERTFHALSRLFAYAFMGTNAKDYTCSKALIGKYLDAAGKYGMEFIDLAALVMIRSSMEPSWTEVSVDVPKQNGWSSDHESLVLKLCKEHWGTEALRSARLTAEMASRSEDNSMIIKVLSAYACDREFPLPGFSPFVDMLNSDPFDMDIAKFILVERPEAYAASVAEQILDIVPEEVLEAPDIIDYDDLTSEHRPDIWLLYLLEARKKTRFDCEQICLRCLSARFQDVRIEAITTLRLLRPSWTDAVIPALEKAMVDEPDPKIMKRIKRLLGVKADDEKERRYVDVSEETVIRSAADKALLDTEIAGTFFRDMDVVTGVLEEGDTLLLKREPENKYDGNAILVTTEDGYVLGYIPKAVNPPLAHFMDGGERLYAVLNADPAACDTKPPITVMVSRAVRTRGNVITFPLGR